MSWKEEIIQKIVVDCSSKNIGGYVNLWTDNLVSGLDTEAIEADLAKGNGNELDSKFRAVHSSSALCVNHFGILKDAHLSSKFTLLGETGFSSVAFEKKMPTGLGGTPPNLDAFFENENCIIGIESKYTEHFTKKKSKFADSYNKSNLTLPDEFWSLKTKYENTSHYLDTAQLLKHTIGLLNNRQGKKAKLLYIYWLPVDYKNHKECVDHINELEIFKREMNTIPGFEFEAMSYLEFWDKYRNSEEIGKHISIVEARYLM